MSCTRNKKTYFIFAAVIFGCIAMAFVEIVITPSYFFKSVIKAALFLAIPFLVTSAEVKQVLKTRPTHFYIVFIIGAAVYAFLLGGYFVVKNYIDFSNVALSIANNNKITIDNFLPVSIYISVVNSFLEELFFRGFAFLTLKNFTGKKNAMVFSAAAFALYHVAIMRGWFHPAAMLFMIAGLFIAGLFFNLCAKKSSSIYPSYAIHMAANLAINTVGFILL